MTVLVGVLCQDGVVVGSDSSATFGAGPGRSTIEQPVQKTFVVGPDIIFAATGAGGLGQRLGQVLQRMRRDEAFNWSEQPHHRVALHLCRNTLEDMRFTFLPPGQIGALVAFACQDGFHLCAFAVADFQPELKTEDTWFVSMGSGQMITDPFFGLLRRTLFRDARPTLDEGILAAVWALHNAIQLNTGGINAPIQLAILERPAPSAPFVARLLGEDERTEHSASIKRIEDYLAAGRQLLIRKIVQARVPDATPPSPLPPSGEKPSAT